MADSIRRMLWGAFVALVVLVAIAVALNLVILHLEKKQEARIIQSAKPLVDAVREMDADTLRIQSAARGYLLTRQTLFEQEHADAVREFEKAAATASQLATDPHDAQAIAAFRRHFSEIRRFTEQQIALAKEGRSGNAGEFMLETARVARAAPDYAGTIADYHARRQAADLQNMTTVRQWLILSMILASIALVIVAAFAVSRIER
ncbi:MAG TPA: CHASE3 domain-containing protein, partial [Gemmatimonadaceae bacterium]|nr:CHASE3 domain-containing protein [Gemmatimonadaceae bacterium]